MKITVENLPEGAEEEIIIRCNHIDDGTLKLISALATGRKQITAYYKNEVMKLNFKDIFYFESVDNKVFAYCEKDILEVRKKLYELEQLFNGLDFVRISKAMIVNITKIKKVVPIFNGRLEAILLNGEKVIISRKYVPVLKKALGI